MTYLLNSIDDAIDRKFLVTKTVAGQAEAGTLVHIMGGSQDGTGVSVDYRVGNTYEDFNIKFNTLKEFSKWARPDNFIVRHYDKLDKFDIQQYIKVSSASFTTFCLPILIVALILIWLIALLLIKPVVVKFIFGICMSILVAFLVFRFYHNRRMKMLTKLYSKIGSGWAGGGISIN
ncbi:MAG TPA: hypothetical protein DCZ71_05495 [Ruminococcus sp.]|nr:hypothetical protein [Ruminococcus sp.]